MKITQTQQNTTFAGHTIVKFKKAQAEMCKVATRIAQERGAIAAGNAGAPILLLDGTSVFVPDKSITDKATRAFRKVRSRTTQALAGLSKPLKGSPKGKAKNEKATVDKFRQETVPNFILELLKEGKLTQVEA